MSRPANFEIVKIRPESVTIRDIGPWDRCLTVTNDADNVVAEMFRMGALLPEQRLFYYDTDGQLDELVHKNGKFVGFGPGDRT